MIMTTVDTTALNRLDEFQLTILFAEILVKLRATSDARSQAATSVNRHAQHEGDRPHGPAATVADKLQSAWNRATSDRERVKIVERAAKALKSAQLTPPPPDEFLERGTPEWERKIARAPGSLREVAQRFGVSHEHVRSLQLKFRGADVLQRVNS